MKTNSVKVEEWEIMARSISRRVLRVLDLKNISKESLSEKLDISKERVEDILNSKEDLTLKMIAKIADALNVRLFDIM